MTERVLVMSEEQPPKPSTETPDDPTILDERTTANSLHRLAHLLDESVPTPNEADKPS